MAGARIAALSLAPALSGETRIHQVARTLRQAMIRGDLALGSRLMGHAQLAAQLGVSRNTVVDALALLEQEGFVRTAARSGTYAAFHLPTETPTAAGWPLPLTRWATRALAGQVPNIGGQYEIDFRIGQPVPELYPTAWSQALAQRAAQANRFAGLPSPRELALGPLETRQALADYLMRQRGAQVTPDMLMLTSGTQASLDALARLFLEEGRQVALEDPTYPLARSVFGASGAQLLHIPVDAHGLIADQLPEHADLLYLTPAAQFPTTVAMPAQRRAAILRWGRQTGALVIEDDYAADLYHTGHPQSVLQGLAPERVILLGSFSKSLAPVSRSGFIVAPPAIIEVLAATRPLTDRAPSLQDALALGDLLASGAYSRHLRQVRQILAQRHQALAAALACELPTFKLVRAHAGLHVLVKLPDHFTEEHALHAAQSAHIGVTPLGPLYSGSGQSGLLLAFAHLSPEQLTTGIRRLRQAFVAF